MSSSPNPYAPSPFAEPVAERVTVRPIQLLQRALAMIQGEYWLFLGITFIGMLLASLAPFGLLVGSLLVFYPFLIFANIAIYVPFIFTFQLIADRKLGAGVAVKASARAAWHNLGGVLWFIVAIGFISFLAALPCYIPALLLLPLTIEALMVVLPRCFRNQ